MAIVKVQEWDARTTSGSATTLVLTVTASVAAGSHLVVMGGTSVASATATVTDSKSNTWATHKNYTRSGGGKSIAIASCKVTNALVNTDTITITWSTTAGGRVIKVVNYSGMHATTHFDVAGTGADTVAASSSTVPGITAAADGELLVGLWVAETAIVISTVNNGFTNEAGQNSATTVTALDWASKIQAAAGASGNLELTHTSGNAQSFMTGFIPAATAPVKNTDPSIAPDPVSVGGTLTCTPGTYTGLPIPTITRQWKRAGVDLSGETGTTYTVVIGDIASAITCVETATNTAGNVTGTSNSVTPTAAAGGGKNTLLLGVG